MRLIKTGLLLAVLPLLQSGAAMAGGYVGNGAGLAEQNFIFALQSLPKSIASCLGNMNCSLQLSDDEKKALQDIQTTVRVDLQKEHPLIFVSGSQNPGFFDLSSTENFRIAKTGLDVSAPIWINTDLIYLADGSQALDFAGATAILIHEVGHQTGRTDHAFLDKIGATVRFALEQNILTYDLTVMPEQIRVEAINYKSLLTSSDIFYSIGSTQSSATSKLRASLHCPKSDEVLLGYDLTNGHFDHPAVLENGTTEIVFRAWAGFNCRQASMDINHYGADVELDFSYQPADGSLQFTSAHSADFSLK